MTVCQLCREKQGLAICQVCGAHVCASHRWSTGDPKDGYYCVDSWCIPKQKTLFSIPPWANEVVDAALPEALTPPPGSLAAPPTASTHRTPKTWSREISPSNANWWALGSILVILGILIYVLTVI